jgi:hypothetical protein
VCEARGHPLRVGDEEGDVSVVGGEGPYSLLHPGALADPYPIYDQLREHDPVHWSDEMGSWLLTRYSDTQLVLRDPRFSAARVGGAWLPEEMQPLGRVLERWMLFQDPPDHTRLRGLVSKAFTPRVVEGLRGRIQGVVDEAIDGAAARGRMDIIADLAYPLPTTVIAELIGIPAADRDQFKAWSADIAAFLGPSVAPVDKLTAAFHSVMALVEYFERVAAERRREPRDDLLGRLIAVEEQGEVLSTEEMFATCVLLLVAGHETTTNLIGNGLLALLRWPEQRRLLVEQPDLIAGAVEELLRYDSPIQFTDRLALEEVVLNGRRIDPGQSITVVLGAANRDPAQFAQPHRLDITRRENRHLAFAYGPHFCLGAPLARLEGQIAIGTLLRRLPSLRLAGGRLEWHDNLIFHGLKALPVEC